MAQHYLTPLFAPRSVAVIGASDRAGSAGRAMFENLLQGGYQGACYPVNPNHATVLGRPALASVEAIPGEVDLAAIATPARTVPEIIAACGRKGVSAALIVSSGFSDAGPEGRRLLTQTLASAKAHGVRVLGPACLGVLRPADGLNLAYSAAHVPSGAIALVCQSGALANAILDWASANEVGFSSVITLGEAADVSFGEILDYLVWDTKTESILLYIEGIRDPRRFVSALRAAARAKPVIVAKAGRESAGYRAALTHSGALVGTDDVFDSVLRRAGAVRVRTFTQLFSAARCLSSRYRPGGNRLAIVTNGGGPGIIAADWAAGVGVEVPELAPATLEKLDRGLPPNWSHGNPLDLCGEAATEHYRTAIAACMEDAEIDGVLAILTPQVATRPEEVARALLELAARYLKPLIACWMGEAQVAASRRLFTRARIPFFRTPEPAVEAFSQIAAHYRNQRLLLQVPGPLFHREEPDTEGARMLIESALGEKRHVLSETESKALLAAFRIPVARTVIAHSLPEALMIAEQIGFPVAMKVSSPDIPHKSDVGGVKLNLTSAQQVRTAYLEITSDVPRQAPGARIDGVAIQPMCHKPHGRELMVGIAPDPVFGPVIGFGAGGAAVEVMGDKAVCLPPLNSFLVRDLIAQTRVSRMLASFRNWPPITFEALENVLLRVSEMACELAFIRELAINPLIVDEHGAIAVDARVVVDYPPAGEAKRYAHMAIHPYPSHLVARWQLADGAEILCRPIRPEDAEPLQAFVRGLSEESRYFRFISTIKELSPAMLARLTQIDYDREMALAAMIQEQERDVPVGVARYATNPDGESCEFALVVADAWQNKGIGAKLMLALMEVARDRGLKLIQGEVLASNNNMLELMAALGFSISAHDEDPSLKRVARSLEAAP